MVLLPENKKLPKNRIAELRKEKKLSQAQLANKTGLTRQAISLYEIGKRDPSSETWIKLANFFNVPATYLMGLGWSRDKVLSQIVENYFDHEIRDDRFFGAVYKYGFDFENLDDLSEEVVHGLDIDTKNESDNDVIYVTNIVDNLLSKEAKKELDSKFNSLTYKLHAYHTELHKDEYKKIAKQIFSKDLRCLNDYSFLSGIGENYESNGISPEYEIARRLKKDLDDKNQKNRQEYLDREPYNAIKEIINNIDFSDTKTAKSNLLELFSYLIDKNEELSERIDEVEGEIYDYKNPDDFNKYSNGDY